jgi:hypothetical protein
VNLDFKDLKDFKDFSPKTKNIIPIPIKITPVIMNFLFGVLVTIPPGMKSKMRAIIQKHIPAKKR